MDPLQNLDHFGAALRHQHADRLADDLDTVPVELLGRRIPTRDHTIERGDDDRIRRALNDRRQQLAVETTPPRPLTSHERRLRPRTRRSLLPSRSLRYATPVSRISHPSRVHPRQPTNQRPRTASAPHADLAAHKLRDQATVNAGSTQYGHRRGDHCPAEARGTSHRCAQADSSPRTSTLVAAIGLGGSIALQAALTGGRWPSHCVGDRATACALHATAAKRWRR
jgi:hypothetical protein